MIDIFDINVCVIPSYITVSLNSNNDIKFFIAEAFVVL